MVRWHSRGCGELSPRVPTQSRVRPHPSVPGCRDSASPAPQWGNHRPRRINCRAKRLRNEQSCSSQRLGVNRGFPLDSSALTLWGWGLGFGVEGVLGSDVSFCSVLGVNRALLGGGQQCSAVTWGCRAHSSTLILSVVGEMGRRVCGGGTGAALLCPPPPSPCSPSGPDPFRSVGPAELPPLSPFTGTAAFFTLAAIPPPPSF